MIQNNLIELDNFEGHELGLTLRIYKANNVLIKKCEYNNETEWLEIGENTDLKRLDKLDRYFPLVFFTVFEAKKYGYIIPCNYVGEILTYHGLSCDPEDLELIELISFDEAIGNHLKVETFECPKCKERWLIEEEYDSHHGYTRKCTRLNKNY